VFDAVSICCYGDYHALPDTHKIDLASEGPDITMPVLGAVWNRGKLFRSLCEVLQMKRYESFTV
jgi:hypothetical protein